METYYAQNYAGLGLANVDCYKNTATFDEGKSICSSV